MFPPHFISPVRTNLLNFSCSDSDSDKAASPSWLLPLIYTRSPTFSSVIAEKECEISPTLCSHSCQVSPSSEYSKFGAVSSVETILTVLFACVASKHTGPVSGIGGKGGVGEKFPS